MTDLDGVARFVDFDVPSEAAALRLSVSRRVAPDLVIPLALPVPPAVTVTLAAVGWLEVEVFDPGRAELPGEHFVRLSGSGLLDWRQQTAEGIARFGGLVADARVRVFERSPSGRVRALVEELAVRDDGSFELYARVPPSTTLTLQARAPGFAPSSASRVAPGRADVVLALEPGRGGPR